MSEESKIQELENILTKNIKSKTLTDDCYSYMSKLVFEDCPKNAKELYGLINDFLSDGLAYNQDEAMKLCQQIYKLITE